MLAKVFGEDENNYEQDDPVERIVDILEKNKNNISINKDGLVSINFSSKEVREKLANQLKLLERFGDKKSK
ncbi:hypothetical protein ID80_005081 [Salmonella enterica subsp. enterica serovar Ball]|nr:hypothetical protein [Salmonella enterica subsp. salamae]EDV5024347.1 hypothetical protein [Salmonella enterica subsp. enterica serovar Ball]